MKEHTQSSDENLQESHTQSSKGHGLVYLRNRLSVGEGYGWTGIKHVDASQLVMEVCTTQFFLFNVNNATSLPRGRTFSLGVIRARTQ